MMSSDGNLMEGLMQFRVALLDSDPRLAKWSREDGLWRDRAAFPKVELEEQVIKVTDAGCRKIFFAHELGKCCKQFMPMCDSRLKKVRIHAGFEGKAANPR